MLVEVVRIKEALIAKGKVTYIEAAAVEERTRGNDGDYVRRHTLLCLPKSMAERFYSHEEGSVSIELSSDEAALIMAVLGSVLNRVPRTH